MEYQVKSFGSPAKAQEWLNEAAKEGWHLVSTTGFGLTNSTGGQPSIASHGVVWVFVMKHVTPPAA